MKRAGKVMRGKIKSVKGMERRKQNKREGKERWVEKKDK